MSAAAGDAYLNTRVSVMASRLLDTDTVGKLSRLTLPELAERLTLPALLDDTLGSNAKSRAVEQALVSLLLIELAILIRPMSATGRALILKWGRKLALFNLTALLRSKLHNLDQTETLENLFELPPALRLPIPRRELFRAESAQELLRILEQTQYGLIARQAREVYEQRRDPFALEAAIDQRYYSEMTRALMQFDSASLQPLRRVLGALLDQVNLIWMLRFRFSYHLTPSETFFYLVPSFRLLHRERLLELVNIDNFEQLIAALPSPLDEELAGSRSLIEVQQRVARLTAGEMHRVLAYSSSGVARALAYLILREREVRLLFSLVQGRLLALPDDLLDMGLELAEPHCPTAVPVAA
jgi:V/A-type H+-transporting ATPase subunit C